MIKWGEASYISFVIAPFGYLSIFRKSTLYSHSSTTWGRGLRMHHDNSLITMQKHVKNGKE